MFRKFKPHDFFIVGAALLSLVYAETAFFMGQHETGIFVGLWVPSFLAFGIYINQIKNRKS